MDKHRRGSGPHVTADLPPTFEHRGDHYSQEDLGARCVRCGLPTVAALAAEGFDTHPACPEPDPDCRKCAGIDDRWHDRGCPNNRKARR